MIEKSKAWDNTEFLPLKRLFSLPDFFFARWKWIMKMGALGRVLQATIIASAITIAACLTITLIKSQIHDKAFLTYLISFLARVSWPIVRFFGTIFAFVAVLEVGSYYQKWKYLSDLFNSAIKEVPFPHWDNGSRKYSCREHLVACLAMDILVMNMWDHRSFAPVFKETLEKAVYVSSNFDSNVYRSNLDGILTSGDIKQVKRYLSDYVDWCRPEFDRLESLTPQSKMSKVG